MLAVLSQSVRTPNTWISNCYHKLVEKTQNAIVGPFLFLEKLQMDAIRIEHLSDKNQCKKTNKIERMSTR